MLSRAQDSSKPPTHGYSGHRQRLSAASDGGSRSTGGGTTPTGVVRGAIEFGVVYREGYPLVALSNAPLTTTHRLMATFNVEVPLTGKPPIAIGLNSGEQLFVLGANGTGKSSLMQRVHSQNRNRVRQISAHRQNWFDVNEFYLPPQQRTQQATQFSNFDTQPIARWKDQNSGLRAGLTLLDLIDAENARARKIAAAVDVKQLSAAERVSDEEPSPLLKINELLQGANIPVCLKLNTSDTLVAVRENGVEYGASELSDGERNALLVAGAVLTVPDSTLVLIDEPERHLHRSIISPLLSQLFAMRPDCAFIIATHEVMLPVDNPEARTLLIRSCTYAGGAATSWDADLVSPDQPIDDEIRRDILGARRRILFVEGEETSLDKSLYAVLFPQVSVVPKRSCRDVEHAVSGVRASEGLHWLCAFGIIDRDLRPDEEVAELKSRYVYALPMYSVESIYYHPEVQRRVAERQAELIGGTVSTALEQAITAFIRAVEERAEYFAERAAEKTVRGVYLKSVPNRAHIVARAPVSVTVDVAGAVDSERERLAQMIRDRDADAILSRYPVRESPALDRIALALGFTNRKTYEAAVRHMLKLDLGAREFVRGLFGDLAASLDAC